MTENKQRTKGKANDFDIFVGGQIKYFRGLIGMSQTELGDSIGVTFQQIQKYEDGKNRVSAQRLHEFSIVLRVEVCDFFDGYKTRPKSEVGKLKKIISPDLLKVIRLYNEIPDKNTRSIAAQNMILMLNIFKEK